MQGFVAKCKHRRRFANFLAMLVVFALCDVSLAFADTLLSVPLASEYNTSPFSKNDGSSQTIDLDCSSVAGEVSSVGMWLWGQSSSPFLQNVYLIFGTATSSNATTTTGTYPAAYWEWTFSSPVECLSGTSTLTFSGTGTLSRGGFSWASGATSSQYVAHDPSWSVPMIIAGTPSVPSDPPSDPATTTSTSTVSTADVSFMLAILLFFMSFAFIAWVYEHNFFPRI